MSARKLKWFKSEIKLATNEDGKTVIYLPMGKDSGSWTIGDKVYVTIRKERP